MFRRSDGEHAEHWETVWGQAPIELCLARVAQLQGASDSHAVSERGYLGLRLHAAAEELIPRYHNDVILEPLRGIKFDRGEIAQHELLARALRRVLVALEETGAPLTKDEQFALVDVRDKDALATLHRAYAECARQRQELLSPQELDRLAALQERVYERLLALSRELADSELQLSSADALLLVGLRLELVRQQCLIDQELQTDPGWMTQALDEMERMLRTGGASDNREFLRLVELGIPGISADGLSGRELQLALAELGRLLQPLKDALASSRGDVGAQAQIRAQIEETKAPLYSRCAELLGFIIDGCGRTAAFRAPEVHLRPEEWQRLNGTVASSIIQLRARLRETWFLARAPTLPTRLRDDKMLEHLLVLARASIARGSGVPFDLLATTPNGLAAYQRIVTDSLGKSDHVRALYLAYVLSGATALDAMARKNPLKSLAGLLTGLCKWPPLREMAVAWDRRNPSGTTTEWEHPLLWESLRSDAVVTGDDQRQRQQRQDEEAERQGLEVLFPALQRQAELAREQGFFVVPEGVAVLTNPRVLHGGMLCFHDNRFDTDLAVSMDSFAFTKNGGVIASDGVVKPNVAVGAFFASGAGCAHSNMTGILHLTTMDKQLPGAIIVPEASGSRPLAIERMRITFEHPGQGVTDAPAVGGADVGHFEQLSEYLRWLQNLIGVYSSWLCSGMAFVEFNGRSLGGQLANELTRLGIVPFGYSMGAWHRVDEAKADAYILEQALTDSGFDMNWPVITTLSQWGGTLPSWFVALRDRLNGTTALHGDLPPHAGEPLSPAELLGLLPPRLADRCRAGASFVQVLEGVMDASHLAALDRGESIAIPDARLGRDLRVNREITAAEMAPIFRDPAQVAAQVERSEWEFDRVIDERLPRLREVAAPFVDAVTGAVLSFDEVLALDWTDMMVATIREETFRNWAREALAREIDGEQRIEVDATMSLADIMATHHDALVARTEYSIRNPDGRWKTFAKTMAARGAARESSEKAGRIFGNAMRKFFTGLLQRADIPLPPGADLFDVVQEHRDEVAVWALRDIDDVAEFEAIDFATMETRLPAMYALTNRWRAIEAYVDSVRGAAHFADLWRPLNLVGGQDAEYQNQRFEPGQLVYPWQPAGLRIEGAVNAYAWRALMAVTGRRVFINPWAGHDHRLLDRLKDRDLDEAVRRANLPPDDLQHGPALPVGMRRVMEQVRMFEDQARDWKRVATREADATRKETAETLAKQLEAQATVLRRGLAERVAALSSFYIRRYERRRLQIAAVAWNEVNRTTTGRRMDLDRQLH